MNICICRVLPGLLVDLVDPVGIVLGVDVVEAVVLEAQAERVELTHTLRRKNVKPQSSESDPSTSMRTSSMVKFRYSKTLKI